MVESALALALVTTAIGMAVAVPAVWYRNCLYDRWEVLESEMANAALEAASYLGTHLLWRNQPGYAEGGAISSARRFCLTLMGSPVRPPAAFIASSRILRVIPYLRSSARDLLVVYLAAKLCAGILQMGVRRRTDIGLARSPLSCRGPRFYSLGTGFPRQGRKRAVVVPDAGGGTKNCSQ